MPRLPAYPRLAAAETLLAIPAFGVDPASSGYDQWTNLLSVAYGVGSSPVGDRRVLPPDLNTITVIKECDASSPKLLEAAADGTVFSEMQIDFVNENQLVFARLKLGSASVASYIFRGASPGDELPLEQVTFNFEKIAASQTDRSETATQEFFFDQFSGELKFSTFLPGSGTPSLVLPGPQVGAPRRTGHLRGARLGSGYAGRGSQAKRLQQQPGTVPGGGDQLRRRRWTA